MHQFPLINAPLKDTCADIGYRCTDPMNKENRESFDVHEYYFHLCIFNHMKNVFISSPALSILVLNLYNSISAHVRVSGVLGSTFFTIMPLFQRDIMQVFS